MAKRNLSEKRLNELKPLVGAFIRSIRRTSLIPSVERLYKETYNKSVDSTWCRHFKAVMESTVAHFEPDGSARLYRDERTAEEVMPLVKDMWTKVETPAPRPHHKKEKPAMADLVYNEETGEFQDPNDEVHIIGSTPKQEESPKVPLFDCTGKLDLSSYKDEDLALLATAFQKALEEERAIRAHRAHVQKVLSVIKEMIASEGLSWDDILKEDGIL